MVVHGGQGTTEDVSLIQKIEVLKNQRQGHVKESVID